MKGTILPLCRQISVNDAWKSILEPVMPLQVLQSCWAAYMPADSAQGWGRAALSDMPHPCVDIVGSRIAEHVILVT